MAMTPKGPSNGGVKALATRIGTAKSGKMGGALIGPNNAPKVLASLDGDDQLAMPTPPKPTMKGLAGGVKMAAAKPAKAPPLTGLPVGPKAPKPAKKGSNFGGGGFGPAPAPKGPKIGGGGFGAKGAAGKKKANPF